VGAARFCTLRRRCSTTTENRAGQENVARMRQEEARHQVELVGTELGANIDTQFHE
jgi:ketol-acid reductoisomerase